MQYNSEQEKIVYKILYDGEHDVFIDLDNPKHSISTSLFMKELKKLEINRLTQNEDSLNTVVLAETDQAIYELVLPKEYEKSKRIFAQLAIHAGKITRIAHRWFKNFQGVAKPILIVSAMVLMPIGGIIVALENAEYQDRIELAKIRYDNVMHQIDMGVDEVEAIRLAIEGDIGMELLKKMTPEEQAELYRDYRDCYQLYKSRVLEDYEPKKSK